MDEWARLMGGKTFITDLGADRTVTVEDVEQVLGRYAVWSPLKGQDGHTIVEVGSDLTALMGRYNIPSERVCAVQTAG
ncbi:MAG: hypothetical protein K2M42_09660 [Oscillospiraceae bacterium]|nr:hypothetical protein [Oscillospiraceae bacterium]